MGYSFELARNFPNPAQGQELAMKALQSTVGVYVESLQPGTDLTPYPLRKIRKRGYPEDGYVLDSKVRLGDHLIHITPEKVIKNSGRITRVVVTPFGLMQVTPDISDLPGLSVMHSYLRKNGGLKILLPFDDGEYVCRIMPPEIVTPVFGRKVELGSKG